MSGYSPILELGDDPHPLTPREKVARAVYDTVTRFDGDTVGTHLGLSAMIDAAAPTVDDERRIVKSVCDDIADSILTALASGSGDHAELARLADDLRKFEHHAVGSLKIGMDEVRRIIAACDAHAALLAENAALRGERDEWRDTAFKARSSNTRAERKLAEAVEWRPIETAPRDGTHILIAPNMDVALWDHGAERWITNVIPLNSDRTIADDWRARPVMMFEQYASNWGIEPTHWLPLPPAPGAEE